MTTTMTSTAITLLRRLSLPAFLAASVAGAAMADAQTVPPGASLPAAPGGAAASQDVNPGPAITGFRGATFGMTETQVKSAAGKEFGLPASAFQSGNNPVQHTGLLTVSVPNLIANGGTAAISYIFGYQSHKLIQISVLWSPQIDPKTTPQMLEQNGATLQQYFAGEGFPPNRSTGGIATQNGILLFRAADPTGNVVALILSGAIQKDPKSPDKTYLQPNTLTLTYAETPDHPDIFQLKPGSF